MLTPARSQSIFYSNTMTRKTYHIGRRPEEIKGDLAIEIEYTCVAIDYEKDLHDICLSYPNILQFKMEG